MERTRRQPNNHLTVVVASLYMSMCSYAIGIDNFQKAAV